MKFESFLKVPKRFQTLARAAALFTIYALIVSEPFRITFRASEAGAISFADVLRELGERGKGIGTASWYSKTDKGIRKHTANGEIFDDRAKTCASWDYPFDSLLRVTNLRNGKSVVCRVNDRGPAKRLNRIVDLTAAAFRRIGDPRRGLIRVSVQYAGKSKP